MTQMVTTGGWAGWAKQTPPPPAKPTLSDRVRFAKTHYRSSVRTIGSGATGLSQARTFTGLTADEAEYVQQNFMGPTPLPKGATIWDPAPPTVFMNLFGSSGAVGEPSYGNDAKAFFGDGGIGKPRGINPQNRPPRSRGPDRAAGLGSGGNRGARLGDPSVLLRVHRSQERERHGECPGRRPAGLCRRSGTCP